MMRPFIAFPEVFQIMKLCKTQTHFEILKHLFTIFTEKQTNWPEMV